MPVTPGEHQEVAEWLAEYVTKSNGFQPNEVQATRELAGWVARQRWGKTYAVPFHLDNLPLAGLPDAIDRLREDGIVQPYNPQLGGILTVHYDVGRGCPCEDLWELRGLVEAAANDIGAEVGAGNGKPVQIDPGCNPADTYAEARA